MILPYIVAVFIAIFFIFLEYRYYYNSLEITDTVNQISGHV